MLHYDGDSKAKGRGTALLRPENFSLVARNERHGALDVTLDQIVFVGSSFELLGRLASGRKLIAQIPAVDRNSVNDLQPGQAARWYYDPATVHLLRAGEGE